MNAVLLCLAPVALGQLPGGGEWQLTPHLVKGQEFVYRGSFSEEAVGRSIQHSRAHRVETRLFVLDSTPRESEIAVLTTHRLRPAKSDDRVSLDEAASLRLEIGRVGTHGKLMFDAGDAGIIPLRGPATLEAEVFVEMPRKSVGPDETWETLEAGRPPRSWQLAGSEVISGTSCVKLIAVQQSDDWDCPRADRAAWRRQDTVWLSPRLGIAQRVERLIEHREPARSEPSLRSLARYELESSLVYPSQLFEERRREIRQAASFAQAAEPILRDPRQRNAVAPLLARIQHYCDRHPPTPYRDAILQTRRRLESAGRGDVPTPTVRIDNPPPISKAVPGQPAPDFVAPLLVGNEPIRLRKLRGKPTLLFFFSPTSRTADQMLRFAQSLHAAHFRELHVVGLAMSDDATSLQGQCLALGVMFPIASGTSLHATYDLESTPKVFLLDPEGVVRATYVGWGGETPTTIEEEARTWIRRSKP